MFSKIRTLPLWCVHTGRHRHRHRDQDRYKHCSAQWESVVMSVCVGVGQCERTIKPPHHSYRNNWEFVTGHLGHFILNF